MNGDEVTITLRLKLDDPQDLRVWRRVRIALERIEDIRGVEVTELYSNTRPDHLYTSFLSEGEMLE